MGRLILSFYNLITNYSRIAQNSELENLTQDHRHHRGWGLYTAVSRFLGCGSGSVYVVRLENHLRDIARYDERRDVDNDKRVIEPE